MLSQERLRELLEYDCITGVWTWLQPPNTRIRKGSVAGTIQKNGYRYITIDKLPRKASRLAFLYMNGELPEHEVDHIDRNPLNDAWINLRSCDSSQNKINRRLRKDNSSGYKGVHFNKRKSKWVARVWKNSKEIVVGSFDNLEDAVNARTIAAKKIGRAHV